MNKASKILVTIVLVVAFVIIGTLLQAGAGVSKTFIALIALGLFYGIRAMWKKDDSNNEPPNSEITLNKD